MFYGLYELLCHNESELVTIKRVKVTLFSLSKIGASQKINTDVTLSIWGVCDVDETIKTRFI